MNSNIQKKIAKDFKQIEQGLKKDDYTNHFYSHFGGPYDNPKIIKK